MRRQATVLAVVLAGGLTAAGPAKPKTHAVPHLPAPITLDGKLDEACYRDHPPATDFTVASAPAEKCGPTKAWVFWSADALTVAFAAADTTPASEPVADKLKANDHDRGELFLWSGEKGQPYLGMEMTPSRSTLDFRATFPKKIDFSWSSRVKTAAAVTKTGYTLEAVVPKAALADIGLTLEAGAIWRAGLFRADFEKIGGPVKWICWQDAGWERPDFHTAESFGTFTLAAPKK